MPEGARAKRSPRCRVAVVGLGPIGCAVAQAILARPELDLVGAVDVDPTLAGKALSTRVPGASRGRTIAPTLETLFGATQVDALGLCTASRLLAVRADLETAIAHGVHVASTCEEMAAPMEDLALWRKLDRRARLAGVTLLGTGVNPGFVMDRLVLQLAGACVSVKRVEVERIVDASKRRAPLRKKVGEGLTAAEFRSGVKAGRLGHVGLGRSAALVAAGLGWKLDTYRETIRPVRGRDGRCLGLHQVGRGTVAGKERISLTLKMYVGAEAPHDRIIIDGDPPLTVEIVGGIHGDRGTVGTLVNALGRLAGAPRGLVTVRTLFT